MKRFLIFIILLSAIYAKGQVHVIRTNGTITPVDFDGSFRYSLKIPVVADTTSAFSHGGIDSLGLVIQVRSTGDWWKRDTVTGGGHKWTKFGAGGGSGTVNVSNSIVGDGSSGTPLNLSGDASAPGNSQYYGTNSSGTKGYNSLNKAAVGLPNADNTSDVNKPVSTAQATAIGLKIANFLNVTFLGYGPHAARPTTGPGLYYDTDSSSLFFVNTGVYNNLFPVFNLFVLSQNSAYPDTNYVKAVGGNLLISPLWDSVGNCIKHLIYPDGRVVWYNSCSNVLNGGASKSISAGTLGSRPAASNCQCYYFSTTDSTWSYDNGSWIPVKGGGGGGTAAGANKQVQINNSGAFGVVPNFTADAATGLVNADSITAHKVRADSLKLNLSTAANKGFGGATKYFQGGNSIGAGTASTTFDSSFVAYNGRLFQLPVIDSAVSGTRTPEIVSMLLRNVNYPNTYVTSIEGGYNNGRNTNVINNRNSLNNIIYSFKAAWWNQFAGPVQNATSGTGVTRTGTWTTGYGGILNAGGKTNGVAYTSSAGAYIEYVFTDSTVGALCEIPTSTASSITVSIDGSVVQTLNPTGKFDGLGAYLSAPYGMFPIIVTGLTNAAHTLRITNVSGGLFLVDCFTNFVPANSANSMALIFYHVPHQNTAGYALNPTYSQAAADTINSKIDSLAAFLPSAWPLYVAKTNTRYDVTTGLSADNIHPNNTGMKQWSLAAADAVNGTPPAPGTIFAQFNPDGSFAGFYAQSEKTGQKNKIAFTTTNGLQDIIINNPTMTTDNVINGAGYKMSFINFLRLIMDSTKMTPGALVQNGVVSAVGPAATVRVGNRGADTTQRGFEWYASGNKISWYDEFSNRNMASGDTSLRFGFFTDPTEGNFNSSNLSAAVHIGGNLQGRAAHAPLKMNFGSLMATPEKGAFEPDSLGGGLWWTKKNGTRVRIDSPTVTAASIPPNIGTGYRIYAPQTPGFKSFVFVNGSIDSTSTSNVLTFKSGSGQGASDADYTATNGATSISLPVITANRTLTVPNANAANTGAFMSIMNNNTAAFTWNVATGGGAGQLRDMNATDITTLLNKTIYFFTNNGSYWILTGTQRIAPAGFDVSGSYSSTGTATTTFTVTMGVTQPNTTYKVGFAPTDALSAAPYYITNKTTTTFDVVYLSGLTGVVSFDWTVTP